MFVLFSDQGVMCQSPLTVSQSGFSCLRMQTASRVIWTRGGGLGKDFISTMSFCLRERQGVHGGEGSMQQVLVQ